MGRMKDLATLIVANKLQGKSQAEVTDDVHHTLVLQAEAQDQDGSLISKEWVAEQVQAVQDNWELYKHLHIA